jgi:thiamine-phosphate pyrophosphorylase
MRIEGLYGLADPQIRGDLDIPELCVALARGGARAVQIRWKEASSRALLEATRAARRALAGFETLLIVNDRPDVAVLGGADGVHVGDEDLPVTEVRRLVGDRLLVGATVRDLAGARAAAEAGADYVGFGPVFPTTSKVVDVAPRGLDALAAVAAASPVPVVAIAGISLENIADVAAAGAHAAAVGSAALRAPSIEARARELREAFEAGRARRRGAP